MRIFNIIIFGVIALLGYFLFKKINPTAFGGWGVGTPVNDPNLAGNVVGQSNTDIMLKKWVDEAVEACVSNYGVDYYPEVINRCANFSKADLIKCINYYNSKYKNANGKFYDLIEGEWAYNWNFSNMYQPALDKFIEYGLTNA